MLSLSDLMLGHVSDSRIPCNIPGVRMKFLKSKFGIKGDETISAKICSVGKYIMLARSTYVLSFRISLNFYKGSTPKIRQFYMYLDKGFEALTNLCRGSKISSFSEEMGFDSDESERIS